MKYFEQYFANHKLGEDIEIGIHCSIKVFE
jgi:hypothetical protein